MTKSRQNDAGDYDVGYRKPPAHTRFQKGRSGNPSGRPRGKSRRRATELALEEFYRPVTVREGDKVVRLPALQAVLRAQVALAAKGSGPAQRALLETAYAIEAELTALAATEQTARAKSPQADLEAARRIAAALLKVAKTETE
jgi:hypothetical protein